MARKVAADLRNTAWQIGGGWVLTGEKASFNGVVPRQPFNPRRGHWGAFEVVARYSQLDVNSAAFEHFSDSATSASSAREWSLGLNWYFNNNVRLLTSYAHTDFDGGGGARAGTARRRHTPSGTGSVHAAAIGLLTTVARRAIYPINQLCRHELQKPNECTLPGKRVRNGSVRK